MDCLWTIHGQSMQNPWAVQGLFMIVDGLSTDSPWIAHGLAIDSSSSWTVHGQVHGQSMGCPWT
eukprot:6523125-Lingulodinium_polyedra.AAC.1